MEPRRAIGLALAATIANSHSDDALATANGRPAAILDALAGGFDRGLVAAAVLAAVATAAAAADPAPTAAYGQPTPAAGAEAVRS